MPELPEVETIVRGLASLVGLKIQAVEVFWPGTIAGHEVSVFQEQLKGQSIQLVSRRGKYIVLALSNGCLLIHLRMTGKMILNNDQVPTSHERLQVQFSNGVVLHYDDTRKFGKWTWSADSAVPVLGIEPLSNEFTLTQFQRLLSAGSRQIKPFLLDQKYIAGLGNIYVDEALWAAKVHPQRPTNSLSNEETQALHTAIIAVLTKGIENQGTSLGNGKTNYLSSSGQRGKNITTLNVFRRNGLACFRCGTVISRMVVGQRGTHFCPHCQI